MPKKLTNNKTFGAIMALIFCAHFMFAGGIDGLILNTDDNPVHQSKIFIQETGQIVQSDSTGKFQLPALHDGNYTLIISHDGYRESVQVITVSSGQTANITIYLFAKSENLGEVEIKIESPIGRGTDISEDEITTGKTKIVLKNIPEKKVAPNSSRGIELPVTITEYDGAGLQLGIGGRGLNPKRTAHYNTRQNGYEISADALGYPETYYTPPSEAVNEISLIRGAASLQYGPQFGGMINFKLKDGPSDSKKKREFISFNKYGSYNQFHTFNSFATKGKKLKTYSFYKLKIGDGWRENSSYTSHTSYTGLSYKASKKLNLDLQLTHHQYVAQQAGGLTDKQFLENPQQSFRERNWFNVNWNIAALIAHYKFNKNAWINSKTFGVLATRNSVGFLENSTRVDNNGNRLLIAGDFQNFGNETRFINRYKIKNKNAAVIAGLRLYKGWAVTSQGLGTDGDDADFSLSPTPEYSQYKFPSKNAAAFVENTFYINKKFYLTPGYRFEFISTETDGYYNHYVINNADDTLQTNIENNNSLKNRNIHLFGTGVTYNAGKGGKLIANVSSNFRSVNFSDINIVIPSFRVDPNIQDEKGFTADLTYNKAWNKTAFLSITGYMLHYANRIGVIWQTDEATFDTYQYRTNVSASRTLGMEISSWTNIGKFVGMNDTIQKLNFLANITTNHAKYIDEEASVFGNWVEMVPAFTAKTSLTYEYKKWLFSGLLNFQTQQFSEATNGESSTTGLYGIIPSFYVLDTKIGYNFKKVALGLSANNLTNVNYFTQRANSYPGPGIIPSEGRTIWASVIVKL